MSAVFQEGLGPLPALSSLSSVTPLSLMPAPGADASPRTLGFFQVQGTEVMNEHDLANKSAVARSIAELLGIEYVGHLQAADAPPAAGDHRRYVVPSHTISDPALARRLGIEGLTDFFGGVVPYPFVGTKVVTHPLIDHAAVAPYGWSHECAERLHDVVLPGYSTFSVDDARRAALGMLPEGSVRLKAAEGVGGSGQIAVETEAALVEALDYFERMNAFRDGVVVERNLRQVETYSVGKVEIGPWVASYFGTQFLTRNGRGHAVYGGSTLMVMRGDFDVLLRSELAPNVRTAVEQALRYHEGVHHAYPAMFASRCNYDVAQGVDDHGQPRSGVLEQSWRIGGASGAEIAALHRFRTDPSVQRVKAATREVYGVDAAAPEGAWIVYDGEDAHGDRLLKYVEVQTDGDI